MSTPAPLTAFQQRMLLSLCPTGSRIVEASYFRRQYIPCPVRVILQAPNGSERILVLRLARHGAVDREACLLPILADMGLPVPEVLAGPESDPDLPGENEIAVYSLLPGLNLQELSQRSADDCALAGQLVLEGARRLASLTAQLRATPGAGFLSTISLRDRLQAVVERDDAWLRERVFMQAVKRLDKVLGDVNDETVFTNGDYQPGNFLALGNELSGFVDFESSCYQDFLFGFAKYAIYDMHPLNKSGFVDYVLRQEQVSRRDFDIRLALGCLITLQREIPTGGGDAGYRDHVLGLLDQACESL